MELLLGLWDLAVHLDRHLATFVAQHGAWVYALLFVIVFCETGLVVTPFLPGDSLLFVDGALAAAGGMDIEELDKKEVRVSGFMRDENGATEGLEFFMIVNEACGCAGEPKLNEVIYCAMPGQKVNLSAAPVKVTGTMYVGEEKDGDFVTSLYRMEIQKIEG